jgi:hypothetical protein
MAPGAKVTYSCQRANLPAGTYTNVATTTGTPINPSGPNVTATDSANVKVAPIVPPKKHKKVVSHKRPRVTG